MSRHVADSPRACPFPKRNTWAVFKVGALWRVLRPARGWSCHEIDSWAGDFATHAEAVTWATSTVVRETWLDRPECPITLTGIERFAWIEGLYTDCVASRAHFPDLFWPARGAA